MQRNRSVASAIYPSLKVTAVPRAWTPVLCAWNPGEDSSTIDAAPATANIVPRIVLPMLSAIEIVNLQDQLTETWHADSCAVENDANNPWLSLVARQHRAN